MRCWRNLRSKNVEPDLIEELVKVPTHYMVYLDNVASREEALKVVQVLRDEQIASFMVRHNEGYRLSLGLYKQKENAEKVYQQVMNLGYTPAMTEKQHETTEKWVVLPLKNKDWLTLEQKAALAAEFPHLRTGEKVCKAVALRN